MMFTKLLRTCLLLLPFMILGTAASAQELILSMPDTSGLESREMIIPVHISDSGITEDIYSFQLSINYNANQINPTEIIISETVSENFGEVAWNTNDDGKISVAASGDSPLNTEGVLFFMRIELLSGTSNAFLSFNTENSYFNERGTIPVTFDNGRLIINALPSFNVSPANSTIFIGEELSMNVSFGTGPVSWESQDQSIATVDENGIVVGISRGTVEISATDTNSVQNDNTAFVDVKNIKVFYDDFEVFQGNEISIPVFIDNPNQIDIYSGTLEFSWAANFISDFTIRTAETLLENNQPVVNESDNTLELAFAVSNPLSFTDAPLFYIDIETSRDLSGTIFLARDAEFNEGNAAMIESGNLRINQLPNIFISPNNPTLVAGEIQQFSTSNTTGPVEWAVSDESIATIDENGLLNALSGGTIQVTAEDSIGAITSTNGFLIFDTWVSTPDTTFLSGQSVELPVRIDELPAGKSVLSYEMEVNYNSSRMTFTGVKTAGSLTEGWSVAENSSNGTFQLASAGTSSFSDAGTIVYLLFDIEPGLDGVTATFGISNMKLNEGDPAVRINTPNIEISNDLSAPSLNSPANNSNGQDINGDLIWEPVDNANQYSLQLATDSNFNDLIADEDNITQTSFSYSLDHSTTYYWRVKAFNNSSESAWSNTFRFTTADTDPDLPGDVVLLFPVNETLQDEDTIEFEWETADNADEYEIDVSEESDFSTILFTEQLNGTSQIFSGFESKTYYWRVRAGNSEGWGNYSEATFDVEMSVNLEDSFSELPDKLKLYQNYPNPFNPSSIIRFDLPSSERVKIEIYNSIGQQVAVLTDKVYTAGKHEVTFNGSGLTSGLYIYRLSVADFVQTRTMTLIK